MIWIYFYFFIFIFYFFPFTKLVTIIHAYIFMILKWVVMFVHTYPAVSYTHLDVYKRQAHRIVDRTLTVGNLNWKRNSFKKVGFHEQGIGHGLFTYAVPVDRYVWRHLVQGEVV